MSKTWKILAISSLAMLISISPLARAYPKRVSGKYEREYSPYRANIQSNRRTDASTTFGKPTIGIFDEVKAEDSVVVGDVLRITYRLPFPFLLDWQKDYTISKLTADPRYEVKYIGFKEEERRLWVEVKVVRWIAPAIIIAAAIAAVLVAGTLYLTTEKIEKLSEVKIPGTNYTLNLFPLLALGVIVIVGFAQWAKVKRAA